MVRSIYIALALALASGCHSSKGPGVTIPDGGGSKNDGGDAGEGDGGNPFQHGDMAGPVDAGPPPAPTTTLVSPGGAAAGLVTSHDGTRALYLSSLHAATAPTQNSAGSPAYGTLHLTDTAGNDSTIGSGSVAVGGYTFSPDGTKVLFGIASSSSQFQLSDLEMVTVAAPTTVKKIRTSIDLRSDAFVSNSFFSADGRYYVFGDVDQGLNASESLVVADTGAATPAVVFEMQNGAFDGVEDFQNGVMYFTAISTASPPVQTLYSLPLAGLTTATKPTTVAERVATFSTTADGSAIYYLTTTGDLFQQPVSTTGAMGAPVQITPARTSDLAPPAVAAYASEPCAAEPCRVAWTGADGALHVSVGTTEIYKTGPKTADLGSSLSFTAARDVYFFQNVKQQELRGILYYANLSGASDHTPAASTSTPVAVFGSVTGLDDSTYNSKATYLYDAVNLTGGLFAAQSNLPAAQSPFAPQVAPLVVSSSPITMIADGVPFGEIHFGYSVAILDNAVGDTASPTRITGAGDYAGTLATTDLAGAATSVVATSSDVVATGNYAWTADGFVLAFIESTPSSGTLPYSTTAMNYTGTLHLFDAGGKTGDHAVTLTGASSNDTVTEVGPITLRSGFVVATSGVYYLTY